eukprot:CAMPEP_0204299186 /NCGR_PEP_ID=MMETSP0468-20130131/76339_1 /ASSEMBLY_ACC=CAM_ASM_000383 /TAXON_ID=2969 /ORGANISM="Oxyrrhis marina" /LENGTH=98 /DNA_ID=CAMNT_0051278153 /DNA_START=164 /DNA_END=456 /DNA_ORIENTATION=+
MDPRLGLPELPLQLSLLLLQFGKIGLDAGDNLHGQQHVSQRDGHKKGAQACDAVTPKIQQPDSVEQVLEAGVDDVTGGHGQLAGQVRSIIRNAIVGHG